MLTFRIYIRESLFPRTSAEGGDNLRPLDIVGALDSYTSFEAISRHNGVGSWTLSVPLGHPQAKMIQPGRGIVVYQEGLTEPIYSGPITSIEKVWDESNAGEGTVQVAGVDDNYILAERLAWTSPADDIHLASKRQYWDADPSWPNVAELLRQLFLANFQGHEARRMDRVFIPSADATANFLSDDTARSARLHFDQPDELVNMLSAVYGFRIRFIWHPDPASVASNGDPNASGPGILMVIEPLSDLTNEVRFGPTLGNLRGFRYLVQAPTATRAVIATQNRTWKEVVQEPTYDELGNVTGYTEREVERTGPERWYGYYTNRFYDPEWWGNPDLTPPERAHTLEWAQRGISAIEAEWGFTAERFLDKRDIPWQWVQDPSKEEGWAQDPPVWSRQNREIMDEVEALLLDQGPRASISIDPIDTLAVYGVHYGLGDLIRIIIDDEVRDEIVREVRLSATQDDGTRISPTVGTIGSGQTPWLYSAVKRLIARVAGVESRDDFVVLQEVPPTDFEFRRVTA